jgi:hypothetical protein
LEAGKWGWGWGVTVSATLSVQVAAGLLRVCVVEEVKGVGGMVSKG